MESGFEYTTEHARLKEFITNLKGAGWHRILISLEPSSLRLTNERNKYVEEEYKAYPDLISAILINQLGFRFDGLLGGDNNSILDKAFSKCRASELGLSYSFYKLLADACQPKNERSGEYMEALRKDLEKEFPIIRKRPIVT